MLHNHILYYIATNLKVNPFIKKKLQYRKENCNCIMKKNINNIQKEFTYIQIILYHKHN